jgi:TolA-binding protein
VYPSEPVQRLVLEEFVPVRVHAREQRDEFKRLGERYNVQWTPTTLVVDANGQERHRIEGFLPSDDFTAQLMLGLAKSAFARGKFEDAERRYRDVVSMYPNNDVAAEAMYWAGVSKYKVTGDATALGDTARAFTTRYTDTPWAKKASVWRA